MKSKFKYIEHIISFLMVFILTIGMIFGGFPLNIYAAMELSPLPLDGNNGGTTTAYNWKGNGTMDFAAIIDGDLIGSENPYIDNNNKNIKATYQRTGYKNTMQVGNLGDIEITTSTNGGVYTYTEGGKNVELQTKLYPSKDKKWIIVEYVIYNNSNSGVNNVKFGANADIDIGDDYATLYRNKRGIIMTAAQNNTFELIANMPDVDPKLNNQYVTNGGDFKIYMVNYADRSNHKYEHSTLDIFNSNNDPYHDRKGDSGLCFSWEINLRPYEKVVKKVAFGTKGPSYYVSYNHGSNANSGTYQNPFQTIEHALTKLNGKLGYIFIQDYKELDTTINVRGANTNVTFASADYNRAGNPITDIVTLKRKESFKESLFKTTESSTLRIGSLIVDGNKEAVNDVKPIIQTDNGTIGLQKGVILQNNQVTDPNIGSAISITGNAKLDINFGTIKDNIGNNKGAIYYNGADNGFTVENDIFIKGNKDGNAKESNVFLANGKDITVKGDLGSSEIYVTSETTPKAGIGDTKQADQEVMIAKAGFTVPGTTPAFLDNFKVDNAEEKNLNIHLGTKDNSGNWDNEKKVVVKQTGFTMRFEMIDSDTRSAIPGANIPAEKVFAEKENIGDIIAPNAPSTTYYLEDIEIEQPSGNTLEVDSVKTSANFGKVTGTMPKDDVVIIYKFKKKIGKIKFESNGGTPVPADILGDVGGNISNTIVPNIGKFGYIFGGWSTVNDRNQPNYQNALPSTFPADPLQLYAIFIPDRNVKFDYTLQYKSENRIFDTIKDSTTEGGGKSVEDSLVAEPKNVPGYKWDSTTSNTALNPANYIFSDTDNVIGSFDENIGSSTYGKFTGKMPGQALTLTYKYIVDTDPSKKKTFKVIHISESGTELDNSTNTYSAEENIQANAMQTPGYEFVSVGVEYNPLEENQPYVYTLQEQPNPITGAFIGKMPNQSVTLKYIYKATGVGSEFKISFFDNGTTDQNLKEIKDSKIEYLQADTNINKAFEYIYGYTNIPANKVANPHSYLTNGFTTNHGYQGKMPTIDLSLEYTYTRDVNLWKDITYVPAIGTTLNNTGVSSDVVSVGSDNFKTSILSNNGTSEGEIGSYTWKQIKDKKLIPNVVVNDIYYRHTDKWFIDTNNNKRLDNTESILKDEDRFTEAVTLVPYLEEDPDKWIDINLAVGTNGIMETPEIHTAHHKFDENWGDVIKPNVSPVANYLFKGWYYNNTKMEDSDSLRNGATYTALFFADPEVFGTEVRAKDAIGSLTDNGKGRITVFDTTPGYKYIITDKDGKIIAVKDGDISGRLQFDNLYPGTLYNVYEANGDITPNIGEDIQSIFPISTPTEVKIPAVENNYTIHFDENNEGKTSLTINPADKDSDYALIDEEGNIVHTPETQTDGWQSPVGNAPSTVTFTNLEYNKKYTVVTRPRGNTSVTPLDKFSEGTELIMDPGGEVEIPKYTIQTKNGEIINILRDGNNILGGTISEFTEAYQGDEVSLYAPAQNSSGNPFEYWRVLVGSANGLASRIQNQNISFIMPKNNMVLSAYYQRGNTGNAIVEDEVRGGNAKEMALDPDAIEDLEDALTTPEDRTLMNINHAKVDYKVVYQKSNVKATESNAIKNSDIYDLSHETAYHAAWGLDIVIERYVNGRKVNDPVNNHPVGFRGQFKTYIQLEKEDVDMMDYTLVKVEHDPVDDIYIYSTVNMDINPEISGGLFTFTAEAGARYVLIYNKAFRMSFVNKYVDKYPEINRQPEDKLQSFKIRKGESPEEYTEYQNLVTPLPTFDYDGVTYQYDEKNGESVAWSYKEDKYYPFKEDRGITRKTIVYAYYKDNRADLEARNKELEELMAKLIGQGDDLFLKKKEFGEIHSAIVLLQTLIDRPDLLKPENMTLLENIKLAIQKNPKQALSNELQSELESLPKRKLNIQEIQTIIHFELTTDPVKGSLNIKNIIQKYNPVLNNRYEHYNTIQTSRSSGGIGGSGGGRGSGTIKDPFVRQNSKNYQVGTNGNWILLDGTKDKWAFVLNGGIRLTSRWGKLDYKYGDTNKNGWYHFNSRGIMDIGWFRDEKMDWYYCNTEKDGWLGKMKTGWHQDGDDKQWYYLDPNTGKMATGWVNMNGKWYYFTESTSANTYAYDMNTESWSYINNNIRPFGSMYKNEVTPDGYKVGVDGAWVE